MGPASDVSVPRLVCCTRCNPGTELCLALLLLVFLLYVSHVLLKHWCSIEQFKGWATTTYEVIFFNADHPNGTLAKSFDCSGHDINTFPETRVHDDDTTSVPGGSFVTKLRLKVTGAPPKDECE